MKAELTIKENDEVRIVWIDACGDDAIIPEDAARQIKSMERTNRGRVYEVTDSEVKICFGDVDDIYHGHKGLQTCLVIPRCMIRRIVKLGEAI